MVISATLLVACGAGSSPLAKPAPGVRVAGSELIDAAGQDVRLVGVNVSGTEDACVLDRGMSWGPLTSAEAAAISSWHADAVRVPLNEDCWLGLNGVPSKYSGGLYRRQIERWVQALNGAGIVAILDLQWSAPGAIRAYNEWPMADEAHAPTFWHQVSDAFRSNKAVLFDLFNEPSLGRKQPSSADWRCWLHGCTSSHRVCREAKGCVLDTYAVAGMQQLVDSVRATGARQPIIVAPLAWSGDLCQAYDAHPGEAGAACAWLAYEPVDPDRQLIAGVHVYNINYCKSITCWQDDIAHVASSVPVITTEVGDVSCAAAFIEQYMAWADSRKVSYLVWKWQVSPAGPNSCGRAPTSLIANWNGQPSTANPEGKAVLRHLRTLQTAFR